MNKNAFSSQYIWRLKTRSQLFVLERITDVTDIDMGFLCQIIFLWTISGFFFQSFFFWRILLLKVMLVGSVIIMSLVIWCPFPFKENMIPCREIHGIIRPSHLCYSELLNACFVSLCLPSSARRCYFLLFSFNIGSLNDVFFSASSLWLQD